MRTEGRACPVALHGCTVGAPVPLLRSIVSAILLPPQPDAVQRHIPHPTCFDTGATTEKIKKVGAVQKENGGGGGGAAVVKRSAELSSVLARVRRLSAGDPGPASVQE